MILIFDFFETLLNNRSIDFNRGLNALWKKYYSDKCSFKEIADYGDELFIHMQELHKKEMEFPFVKEELPLYAERFGGMPVSLDKKEEAEFLMLCNEMELLPGVGEMLNSFLRKGIPMYVLSNSGFTADALQLVLEHFGIETYFEKVWSSADFGKIKPCREFFEQAIQTVLSAHPKENREEILFIGDTYATDVMGAHNAGIKAVWINRKKEKDILGYADYEIAETNELMQLIPVDS